MKMKCIATSSAIVSYDMNTSRQKLHQTQSHFYGQIGDYWSQSLSKVQRKGGGKKEYSLYPIL